MNILAIETSCDETSAAIVRDGREILANVVATSAQMHAKYGGIVPEVAARKQLEFMIPVLEETLNCHSRNLSCHSRESGNLNKWIPDQVGNDIKDRIDAIAVAVGPGLIGSLLVGVETAKTLALAWNKPIIPVNHVLAHPYAAFLGVSSWRETGKQRRPIGSLVQQLDSIALPIKSGSLQNDIVFPAISLVVSGGHTELYFMKNEKSLEWIGGTLDDAAGECFDKCARLLGLKYPGGPEIAAAAAKYKIPASPAGRPNTKYKPFLPRPMIHDDSFNFSFSGLKTAVLREVKKLQAQQHYNNLTIQQLAYEIQESITDVLVKKTLSASEKFSVKSIIVAGGVAANLRLKEKFSSKGQSAFDRNISLIKLFVPPPHLCVDTAAYIASYAYYHNNPVNWRKIEAMPNLNVEV